MTCKCEVPFERSYWVVPGKLLAGCYPGDADPEQEYMKLKGLVKALRRNDPTAISPSPETSEQCGMVRSWHSGE